MPVKPLATIWELYCKLLKVITTMKSVVRDFGQRPPISGKKIYKAGSDMDKMNVISKI